LEGSRQGSPVYSRVAFEPAPLRCRPAVPTGCSGLVTGRVPPVLTSQGSAGETRTLLRQNPEDPMSDSHEAHEAHEGPSRRPSSWSGPWSPRSSCPSSASSCW
jgi:hypothetical protein